MKPIAISLAALAALVVVVVFALLSGHSAATGTKPEVARTSPVVVSRSLKRPPWLVLPSITPATAQTSPSTHQARSVAAGSLDAKPEREAGAASRPTAYEQLRARIAFCESRNDPKAVNKTSGASGLWQFLGSTWRAVTGLEPPASDYPPQVQTRAFDALYAASGTAPWASSRSCWQ